MSHKHFRYVVVIEHFEIEEIVFENDEEEEDQKPNRSLYNDLDFPATVRGLNLSHLNIEPSQIQWLRPKQICPNAEFIKDGFSRSDVSQGSLGDCWILAAMAGMAERAEIINRVVPVGQTMKGPAYNGAFCFRLRKFGQEVEVFVDDRLPTMNGVPLYSKPLNGEFWVCLLEKAMAKFYGSYESLDGGKIYEALADLTGGVCEEIDLQFGNESEMNLLARHLDRCLNQRGSVVGASSLPRPKGYGAEMGNGLIFGHAYTVTGLKTIEVKTGSAMGKWRKLDLIRVRNPWGSTEWKGDWSDNYRGWTEEQKRAVQLVSRDDGEFWMSFADFSKFFRSVTILHFGIPASTDGGDGGLGGRGNREWRCHEFYGEWKRGVSAGGQACYSNSHYSNPQYEIDLVDSPDDEDDLATCLVSLEEPDQRCLPEQHREYIPKMVYLYSQPSNQTFIDAVTGQSVVCSVISRSFSSLCCSRTIVHRFRVTPGRYCVMPCTDVPGQEAQFLLRVFTEA